MSIWRLTLREISHRKAHFVLGLVSITAAVAAYIAADMLLRDSSHRDQEVLNTMAVDQKKKMASFEENLETTLDDKRVQLEEALADTQSRLRATLQEREKEIGRAHV